MPWYPGTYATSEEKLQALKMLMANHPNAGWTLLLKLLPKRLDTSFPTHRFKWRTFGDEEPSVSNTEYFEYLFGIMDCIVCNINTGDISQKWEDLIPELDHFSDEYRVKLVSKLKEALAARALENRRVILWDKLRTLINHHRSYPDTDWAMPTQEIDKLQDALTLLEPTTLTDKYAWLFTDRSLYGYDDSSDLSWEEKNAKRAAIRIEATRDLVCELSESEFYSYILELDRPDIIGNSLADIFNLDDRVQKTLLNVEIKPAMEIFLIALINKSFHSGEWVWADQLISQAKGWPQDRVIVLFLGLPINKETWERLEEFSQEIQNTYWQKINPLLYQRSAEELEYVVKKLLEHDRVASAFRCVAYHPENKMLSGHLVKKLLEEILRKPEGVFQRGNVDQVEIGELFEILDKSDEVLDSEIGQLEFNYCSILIDTERESRILYSEIAKNPNFYAELISYAYLPKSRDRSEDPKVDHKAQQLARTAKELLDNCNVIPGSLLNESIDEEILLNWIKSVRNQSEALDRLEVANNEIGHFLARVPRDPNTLHPHTNICSILQKLQNDDIDIGFRFEILNSRGVTWREKDDQATEEKALAAKYEQLAEDMALTWPRVSKIMKDLADNYIQEAKMYQQEHELRQKRY